MNICFIDYDLSVYGGTGTVVASLSDALKKNHSVYLFSITEPAADFYNKKEIVCENLGAEKVSLLQMRRKYHKDIMHFIEDNHIDIVLLIGIYSGIIALPFSKRRKSKFIFCDHGALINQLNDKKATVIRILMTIFADKVVVLTERTLNDYRKLLKTPRRKLEVIYNPVPQKALECCGQCNLQSKKIVSSGRFGREKGYDMLLGVAQIVLPRHKDWEWHIYGDGTTYGEIQHKIAELHLEHQLILKGKTDKMYELYRNYSLLVLTSYREGLPMVLLEAQVNHLPVVSFDVATGPAEIVDNNVNGFLIPPYNIEDMAEKIEIIMNDDDKRIEFSRHSTDNIDRFKLDIIIGKWNSLFEKLVCK